jgi:hypothetical protein
MPAGREVRRVGVLETRRAPWATMLGIRRIRQGAHTRLVRRGRTLGGCTTCTETSGSGAPTGMRVSTTGVLRQMTPRAQIPGDTVSAAAGRGPTSRGPPARPTAAGTRQTTGPCSPVSVLPGLRSPLGSGRVTLCGLSVYSFTAPERSEGGRVVKGRIPCHRGKHAPRRTATHHSLVLRFPPLGQPEDRQVPSRSAVCVRVVACTPRSAMSLLNGRATGRGRVAPPVCVRRWLVSF